MRHTSITFVNDVTYPSYPRIELRLGVIPPGRENPTTTSPVSAYRCCRRDRTPHAFSRLSLFFHFDSRWPCLLGVGPLGDGSVSPHGELPRLVVCLYGLCPCLTRLYIPVMTSGVCTRSGWGPHAHILRLGWLVANQAYPHRRLRVRSGCTLVWNLVILMLPPVP